MNILKALLKTITGSTDRYFTAAGRPDESVSGKTYQHYGFRSSPPANVELMTLQYGNNTVSVAENDGSLSSVPAQSTGDVRVYSIHTDMGNTNEITLQNNILTIRGQKNIGILVKASNGQVVIGSNETGVPDAANLLTIYFYSDSYTTHTHGTPSAPTVPVTGPPISAPEQPGRPWYTFFTGAN